MPLASSSIEIRSSSECARANLPGPVVNTEIPGRRWAKIRASLDTSQPRTVWGSSIPASAAAERAPATAGAAGSLWNASLCSLAKLSRGVYTLASSPTGDRFALALASTLVPNGVVCLESALRFHGLTTEPSPGVWIALGAKAWQPRPKGVPLRVVRFSGDAFSEGVEKHDVEGLPVRVYGLAKTIADCFKFRNRIGLQVVLDALWEGWRESRFTKDELLRWGAVRRVTNVMQPYLESLA